MVKTKDSGASVVALFQSCPHPLVIPPRAKSDAVEFLEQLVGGPLTFARLIRSIRLGEEETLAKFGARLGVSRQNLSDVEQDRRPVSVARAMEWAAKLGYSLEQFAELAGMKPSTQDGLIPSWCRGHRMKQLALRLDDDKAARYKSKLAADRISMQEHLVRHVDSYLASPIPTDQELVLEAAKQPEITAAVHGSSELRVEAELQAEADLRALTAEFEFMMGISEDKPVKIEGDPSAA